MEEKRELNGAKEVVLRNYVPKDTPEHVYKIMQVYHYALIGLFLFWVLVRALSIAGTQSDRLSQTAIALMPVEVRSGVFGAFICVIMAAYNLTTAFGLVLKERWGWWLGLIGLCWGIVQAIGDALIALLHSNEWFVGPIHLTLALGMVAMLCWLIYMFVSPGMRTKFEVTSSPAIALAIAGASGVVLGMIFLACAWPTSAG